MKEFKTSNGIPMVEGVKYNWQKQHKYYDNYPGPNPYSLSIDVSDDKMNQTQFMYYKDEGILSIAQYTGNSPSIRLKVGDNIAIAEAVIESFCLANTINHSEVMPIYQKSFHRSGSGAATTIPNHILW